MTQIKSNLPLTQYFLDILNVKDNILILKRDQYRLILSTNAINFDLLSENEQDAMIYAYAGLINSLEFPLEVVIHTRPTDISDYLVYLESYEKKQPNETLREQIAYYRDFIKQLVIENNVLSKRFYIVIPYMTAETKKTSILEEFTGRFKKQTTRIELDPEEFEKAKTSLNLKKEEVLGQLHRMGIRATQLDNKQIIELFYELYNPQAARTQKINEGVENYTTTVIKPAVE